ncbi:hypothetical protein FKP32DRAFT_1242838 [Trametes sanguinea]|nr:hypothetical protein FKP32DRAFT_1242838 [Trametes sanguinea]
MRWPNVHWSYRLRCSIQLRGLERILQSVPVSWLAAGVYASGFGRSLLLQQRVAMFPVRRSGILSDSFPNDARSLVTSYLVNMYPRTPRKNFAVRRHESQMSSERSFQDAAHDLLNGIGQAKPHGPSLPQVPFRPCGESPSPRKGKLQ